MTVIAEVMGQVSCMDESGARVTPPTALHDSARRGRR